MYLAQNLSITRFTGEMMSSPLEPTNGVLHHRACERDDRTYAPAPA